MASRGVLFALTNTQARRFLAAASDDELDELIEEVEEAWNEKYLEETDTSWDIIHRCLADEATTDGAPSPLCQCILGGKQLYQGDDYIIAFVSADDAQDMAAALAGVTEPWFRERFSRVMEAAPPEENRPAGATEALFSAAWGNLVDVRAFYQRAARARRAVIFTADQ